MIDTIPTMCTVQASISDKLIEELGVEQTDRAEHDRASVKSYRKYNMVECA